MAINQVKRRKPCVAVKNLSVKQVTKCVLSILWEFCSFTSLHGIRNLVSDVRYLNKSSTKKRFSRKQRVMAITMSAVTWGGAFIIGAIFALIMIVLIWKRFQTTPTITTVETYYYPIWNVPFPAVTICSLNKVHRPATKNIKRKLLDYGVNEMHIEYFFSELSGLVQAPRNPPNDTLLNVFDILQEIGYTSETLMREVMQPCNRMLYYCNWLNKDYPCEKLFHVSKGSEGFCCSFNYNATNISLHEDKYFRVSGAGDYVGLEIMLSPDMEHYVSYTKAFYGFTMVLHFSGDFVDMPSNVALVQPGYFVKALVTPSVIQTDEAVRSLPLKQRECLFPDERNSSLQNEYRHLTCMADCRLQGILQRCNCIPFYFPHTNLPAFSKYRQCSIRDFKCMRRARSAISSLRPPNDTLGFHGQNDTGLECDCVAGCFEIRYDTQFYTANRERGPKTDKRLIRNLTVAEMNSNFTTMLVCFKTSTCTKYKRSLYMTWDGFFASFGGIFGLCLGGSVVSLIELIYFIIVRIFGRILMTISTKQKAEGQQPISPNLS